MGSIPCWGRPQKIKVLPLIYSAMPSLSTAGRPGWMPPAPTGPWGQRCSSVIIIPGSGRGALRPPLALLPGLAGEAGQRGSPLSAPPPPAGPGHCAKGPKAPRTLVTRATGDSVQHGLLEPPANQGETRETGPLLHAPRHPPAATTSTGLPALRGHPTHPGRVGMADPQSTGPLTGGVK